jgi:hypothetical protein
MKGRMMLRMSGASNSLGSSRRPALDATLWQGPGIEPAIVVSAEAAR